MSRLVLTVAVAVALLASGVAWAAAPPALRLVGMHPLRITATHFKPRERVVVTVAGRTARAVRIANASGSFTVTFAAVSVGRCERAAIRAVGTKGSVGVLKLLPAPACISS